jgi:hypothetical protein
MQLQINPLLDAHRHYLLHIPGARTEGQTIESVQSPLLIVGSRSRTAFISSFFLSQQLRDRTFQAQTENRNSELGAVSTHKTWAKGDEPLQLSTLKEQKSCLLSETIKAVGEKLGAKYQTSTSQKLN